MSYTSELDPERRSELMIQSSEYKCSVSAHRQLLPLLFSANTPAAAARLICKIINQLELEWKENFIPPLHLDLPVLCVCDLAGAGLVLAKAPHE